MKNKRLVLLLTLLLGLFVLRANKMDFYLRMNFDGKMWSSAIDNEVTKPDNYIIQNCQYIDKYLGVNYEGSEPSDKKYFMEIVKPDGYQIQKYQYVIWKILRDKGYERTDCENADIIIKADYHEYIFNPHFGNVTNGTKIIDLDLYAYPKSYNDETIPYWKVSMQKGGQNTMHFLYFMDWFWFQKGFHFIQYRINDKDWNFIKFKDDRTKFKAQKEDVEKFNLRIKYLNDENDINLFNEQAR